MAAIQLKDVGSVNDSLILGFIPGTAELLQTYASMLTYASFERIEPEKVHFLVTGSEQLVIGCLIVSEKTGNQLFALAESAIDADGLADWVDPAATYVHISNLEIWEQYQSKGFGTLAVEEIVKSAKYPVTLYSVGESLDFWDRHFENMSGYWYCQQKNEG